MCHENVFGNLGSTLRTFITTVIVIVTHREQFFFDCEKINTTVSRFKKKTVGEDNEDRILAWYYVG